MSYYSEQHRDHDDEIAMEQQYIEQQERFDQEDRAEDFADE
jgi:hypothetical protein